MAPMIISGQISSANRQVKEWGGGGGGEGGKQVNLERLDILFTLILACQ